MTENFSEIEMILKSADSISLEEMNSVKLLNRIDSKYVLHISRLPGVLRNILAYYKVLDIEGTRLFSYNTVYFDTPDLQFYKDHHNGLNNRIKVRCRQYIDNDLTFFEIKKKYMGYRTDKYRRAIEEPIKKLGAEEYDAIRAKYTKRNVEFLKETLQNSFKRITFVNRDMSERFTIDLSLRFALNDKTAEIDKLVIIEVKQEKANIHSPVIRELKKQRIFPGSVSKYILGVSLMKRDIKQNAFKMILSRISKIQNLNGYNINGQLAGG